MRLCILLLATSLFLANPSSSQVKTLCVRKRLNSVKRVKLKKSLIVVNGAQCPARFKAVTSNISFEDGINMKQGDAAAGALSGQYPNPDIADGAITTTKISDDAITSDKILDRSVGIEKLSTRPMAKLSLNSNFVVPSNTETNIEFDTEDFDTANMIDLGTSNVNIMIPVSGIYSIKVFLNYAGSESGTMRQIRLYKNDGATDTFIRFINEVYSATGTVISDTALVSLNVGDTVRLATWHTGSSLDATLTTSSTFVPDSFSAATLSIAWAGSAN